MPEKFSNKKRILLVAANPANTDSLQLPKEFRKIEECIERTKKSEFFDIKQIGATRIRDLRRTLNSYKPHIVHFSGHGVSSGILLEDESGHAQNTPAKTLADLINLTNKNIECVILNACYSQNSAEAISEHVPYSIGMNAPVGDLAAIEFAIGFYDGIANGDGYKKAYQFGENAFSQAENQTPRSFETSQKIQITSPKLFKKRNKKPCQNEEQTNQTPWFHHTIDHQQLRAIDLFNKQDNLIFGHFIAKGSDAPESFVKHCYIEMLGGRCSLEDNIEQNIHHIKLDGIDKNSFENSVFKQLTMDALQPWQAQHKTQQKLQTIRHWLVDQRKVVVLYIPLSNQQQKKNNAIIQGTIDTLSALNLGKVRVLTLFRCSAPPKKRWLFFSSKPASPCEEMGILRQLTEDDIYDWLDELKARSPQKNHPEEKLIEMMNQKSFNYRDALNHLRDIHYQYAR